MNKQIVAIIGGGAAGYFFAANAAGLHPDKQFIIFEQAKQGLQKVKISGGGRCNLTHACFEPKELTKNYPRGEKELLGPFYNFGPNDTINWFEERGVKTKTEADGRMFPISNQSQSIIDCLKTECEKYGVQEVFSKKLLSLEPINKGENGFWLHFKTEKLKADQVFMAAGSSKMIWKLLAEIDYKIVNAVPSLFTFKIKDPRIEGLAGISFENVVITLKESELKTDGPLLITHKGLSGPAILKLSAFGARVFAERAYNTKIIVNFLPDYHLNDLKKIRDEHGKLMIKEWKFGCPKRLQASLLNASGVDLNKKWASCGNKELEAVFNCFCKVELKVTGQNTFKEEFVTAGGVDLSQINFKNFSSKLHQNLFFAGEVLNIDAVTGGFNFQAAWTGAHLAAIGLQ